VPRLRHNAEGTGQTAEGGREKAGVPDENDEVTRINAEVGRRHVKPIEIIASENQHQSRRERNFQ
jgi:hypothetical protein